MSERALLPRITHMDRARLIALIMIAAAIAMLLAAAHAGFHPGGMNDGGYW
jgi:hypothetical protein